MHIANRFIYIFLLLVNVSVLRSNVVAKVPALFVFGDSIADSGNNNGLKTLAKCNFPPYGKDFEGHRATGRFSNGKTPSDFLASQLGIKEYLPAYLDPELSDEDLLTGVCFASGGAGFDNITAEVAFAYTMWDQLQMFEEYKGKLVSVAGLQRAAKIVNQSIYFIITGSNDIMVTYFNTKLRSSYNISSYTDYAVQTASSFITKLYDQGARKIGALGLPPLGYVPMVRTLRGGIKRESVDIYNQASALLNEKLSAELTRLTHDLPGSQIMYIDVFSTLLDLIMNSSYYGFDEVSKGCCGTGMVEATYLCTEIIARTCDDASKYIFWDSFHPTERAYELLVTPIAKKYLPTLI